MVLELQRFLRTAVSIHSMMNQSSSLSGLPGRPLRQHTVQPGAAASAAPTSP